MGDLGSMFSGLGNLNASQWGTGVSSLGSLYGALAGIGTATNTNNQVQPSVQQNTNAVSQQIANLQAQQQQQYQQAQQAYSTAQQSVAQQNAQLQGTIGTEQQNLADLSNPNSPYMQNLQNTLGAQDAAAGRNSQYGQRAVQLQGDLAQYVAQNSPAMTSAIANANNSINTNNTGLATLYQGMMNPQNQSIQDQINALKTQQDAITTANGAGRNSANAVPNSMTTLIGAAGKAIPGLAGLFGGLGSGGSGTNSILATGLGGDTSYAGNYYDLLGSGNGTYGVPSANANMTLGSSGYGNLPQGSYFGGMGGIAGTPTSSIWDNEDS